MNEIMESRDLSHQQTSRLIIQCEMMLVRTFRVCVAYTSEIKGVVHQKYLHDYFPNRQNKCWLLMFVCRPQIW